MEKHLDPKFPNYPPGQNNDLGSEQKVVNPVWVPQYGSQLWFLSCPFREALYEGTRGPGKTDALVMSFAQHVDKGFGPAWRGILFRRTYPELADVTAKTKYWFNRLFPKGTDKEAKFNGADHKWTWPDGEELLLRYMRNPDDYWNYHGHEYPWIGWEELTSWPSEDCYIRMMACNRTSRKGIPRLYRSTANPYGAGHHWVKARFIDPAPAGSPIEDSRTGEKRVRIKGYYWENKILLEADPDYVKNNIDVIRDYNLWRAWKFGDWDIVAGGAIIDVWSPTRNVVRPFGIPNSWKVDRSFDWGSSKPFSVGWWAESDGTVVKFRDGKTRTFPRGSLFRVAEWYGWNGQPNTGCRLPATEVARKIKEIENNPGFLPGHIVRPGPADTQIFDAGVGVSIADDMRRMGIRWTPADKRPGSRKSGLDRVRRMLLAAHQTPMEEPAMFIFDTCNHWLRTVPVLPRDDRDMDDVDTDAEDHAFDETRYRAMARSRVVKSLEM